MLLERGEPVYGYPFSGYWLDMGTPEKYLQLNCDLLLAKAKSALIDGLEGGMVHRGEGVVLHPSAEIVGPAVLGSGCKIGQGVRIRGPVVMGPDCHIGEGAVIERAVLWEGVSVGMGAALRGCVLGCGTAIDGNARVFDCTIACGQVRGAGEDSVRMLASSETQGKRDVDGP